jgi:hypothetical protein
VGRLKLGPVIRPLGAMRATRLLRDLLYEGSTTDPLVLGTAQPLTSFQAREAGSGPETDHSRVSGTSADQVLRSDRPADLGRVSLLRVVAQDQAIWLSSGQKCGTRPSSLRRR